MFEDPKEASKLNSRVKKSSFMIRSKTVIMNSSARSIRSEKALSNSMLDNNLQSMKGKDDNFSVSSIITCLHEKGYKQEIT